jgi:hypothetical protein
MVRDGVAVTLALAVVAVGTAYGHNGGKLRGTCSVENKSGRASVTVKIDNLWGGSVVNLSPSPLMASSTGSATLFVQTSPRPLREVLGGKSGQFSWKGRFYGDGYLDLTVEVGGRFEDSDETETTGLVNCNRVAVGNVNGPDPTATPENTEVPPTQVETPVPATATARRPTRTPIEPRPTRTPRTQPTETEPPTPTRTATAARPTRTPIAPRPTRTPIVHEQRPTNPPRPTRTPIVHEQRPTNPPRPTRTPILQPTNPPTRQPTTAPTRAMSVPTRTPVPERPTRTPIRNEPRPTNPPRPTRTPNNQPSPTPVEPDLDGGLAATCSLRRTEDFVVVTMLVHNRSGIELKEISVSPLDLDPEGGALIFDRAGPIPNRLARLRDGASASFQWTARLTPGGTMGFSAFATAGSDRGPLQTPMTDCGVTGVAPGTFDPSTFNGECSINPGTDGQVTVSVRNASRETLTEVDVAMVSRAATGSAGTFEVQGPAPRVVSSMPSGSRREFIFGAKITGDGTVTLRFIAHGSRPTHQRVDSAQFECTATVGREGGGGLPDLAVDAGALRSSLSLETRTFPSGDCAVVERCVNGTGPRRLLKFSTVTPNYGPGDVFMGSPFDNPRFIYSACHDHFHFEQYADYRLLDMSGNVVSRGHKQAFCLVDLWPLPGGGGDPRPQFPHCNFQGISAGWADIYHSGLDCQWVDVTGVPSGRYVLEVEINPARVIQEHNYGNNVGRAEVTIP